MEREMDADGRTLTVSSVLTRVELDELIDGLRAAGCTEIDASEELRRIEEAERQQASEVSPMPGIEIRKVVTANEMAVEEPRRLPSGHYAMPGIRVGRLSR